MLEAYTMPVIGLIPSFLRQVKINAVAITKPCNLILVIVSSDY